MQVNAKIKKRILYYNLFSNITKLIITNYFVWYIMFNQYSVFLCRSNKKDEHVIIETLI